MPRIDAPCTLHHIVIRGIEGKAIFEDDHDREDFLGRLSRLLQEMDAGIIRRHRSKVAGIYHMPQQLMN